MEKRNRTRLLRVLLPILGLALALAALWAYRYYTREPVPKTLKEYYSRLYPQQWYTEDLDRIQYDYPRPLSAAETVLVVTPEGDLIPGAGKGYSQDRSYAGTNLRVKYRAWDPRTYRRVKVLEVIKGNARPGDVVGVWEYCAVTEEEHLLIRYTDSDWPMVKGCAYLLFLNGEVSLDDTRDVRTICGANGWFDLTHLSLNEQQYLHVLAAALSDLDMLTKYCAKELGALRDKLVALNARSRQAYLPYPLPEDLVWTEFTLTTPRTDRRFPLEGRYTDWEGQRVYHFGPWDG